MEINILSKIQHFPLIITKIFEYSLKRPFILFIMIEKSYHLRQKFENFKIEKYNMLSKDINKLYSLSQEIMNFEENFKILMKKGINIEEYEHNFYITKPFINSVFDFSDKIFSYYQNILSFDNIKKNSKYFFIESLFEFCLNQSNLSLSINLYSKENDINTINMELNESDLDYNYIKYINRNHHLDVNKEQKLKLIINIYNKYNRVKSNHFYKNIYFNNINLLKNLNIEEIYFIRPNIKEIEKIENILYKNEIVDDINNMFILLKELKNKNQIININFSDSIIKNISSYYKEIRPVKLMDNNNNFKNLKNIGINTNLIDKNIKDIIFNLFNYDLSVVYYQDIIKYVNNNNYTNNHSRDDFYINIENNIIYDVYLFKYLYNIFNKNNSQLSEKITKLQIIYNCEDINSFAKNNYYINENLKKEEIKNCYLPNLKEIIIKNNTNKIYKENITSNTNKIFNIISFLVSNSKNLSTLIIQDSYIPFNLFDINNMNINTLTNLNIKSPFLNNYAYSEIIKKINNFYNLQYISIDTLSSNFDDSFDDIKISKNMRNIKEFKFNDFFVYKKTEKSEIIFKQNYYIEKNLFDLFSSIIENEKNIEKIVLNGFHYNLDNIKNQNIKDLEINLEENDKDYKINRIKFKNINLRLYNFPNLINLYIYVDILQKVDNFIQFPLSPNLKRIFLFSSYINCDINSLDNLLKNNGIELIVRIIDNYNKAMIMAYIASFPNIQ